jgi:hypothetical protein
MAYRNYRSRSTRRLANKSKNNLIATILISLALLFVTITWVLPNIINGVGFINHSIKPTTKQESVGDNATQAPPVLSIPFEATNQSPIDIKGYATPGVTVKIFLDDNLVSTVNAKDDGSFTANSVTLNFGTNNIYGKTVDNRGKESLPSKTIRLTYDNEKPDLNLSEPEDGKVVQGQGTIKVAGTTEATARVTINNVQIVVKSDGNFSTDFPINDGDNNLNIKSIDMAGNVNEINRKVTKQP